MANRLYNKQVTPKGYKRGGGVTGEKKPGIIRKAIGNVRKKQIFDAINAAEKSKSKEPFAIKFANEYHKLTRGEDQPIKKNKHN